MLFSGVRAVRASAQEASPSRVSELPDSSLKVLVKAGLEPGIRLLGIYESLGMHPTEGKGAMDDVLARGMVRVHRLIRKGKGGQPCVVEVLPAGIAELAKRGIKPAEKKLKRGGFLHDVYARLVEKWAKRAGYRQVWFERTLGQKAFDLVMESVEGQLEGVEVCLTGTAKWNASQAVKAGCVEGVAKVIVACESVKLLKDVEEHLGEMDGLGLYEKKIELRLLSEYVTE